MCWEQVLVRWSLRSTCTKGLTGIRAVPGSGKFYPEFVTRRIYSPWKGARLLVLFLSLLWIFFSLSAWADFALPSHSIMKSYRQIHDSCSIVFSIIHSNVFSYVWSIADTIALSCQNKSPTPSFIDSTTLCTFHCGAAPSCSIFDAILEIICNLCRLS